MERHEFLAGWLLLTTQPWGKPYRSTDASLPGHEPSPAEIQQELYWKALHLTNPFVWEAVCADFAAGDHWPSIGELKTSIHQNTRYDPQVLLARHPTIEWQDAPWPLQLVFNYQKQYHSTIKEAAFKVLPQWLDENPNHEDYADARLFLDKAKNNFGVSSKQRGNIRMTP